MRATAKGIVSSTILYINKTIVKQGSEYIVKNSTLDSIYENIKRRLNTDTAKADVS